MHHLRNKKNKKNNNNSFSAVDVKWTNERILEFDSNAEIRTNKQTKKK